MRKVISSFDDAVDKLFENLRGKSAIDKIFYWASELADYSRAWHVFGLLVAAVTGLWFHWLRLAVTLAVESLVVNGGIKKLTNRPRPAISGKLSIHGRRPKTTSLPSGHASSATVAAVLLSVATPTLTPLWVTCALVVSVSRIHNRMHHASDVISGVFAGGVFSLAAIAIWPLT